MNATSQPGLENPDPILMWGSLALMIVGLVWSWVLGEWIDRKTERKKLDSRLRGNDGK